MFINSKGNYVDGKWNVASGEIMCSVSPVTEESIWQGNASNAQEIQSAVIAAKKAFGYWSKKM
jgi:succinylglutamic semialdehyde dehydrogenase